MSGNLGIGLDASPPIGAWSGRALAELAVMLARSLQRLAASLVTALTFGALAPPDARADAPADPRDDPRARPAPRDRTGVALDASFGGGLHAISDHGTQPTGFLRVGVGVGRGRTALLLSGMIGPLGSIREPMPEADLSYMDLGVEPSLRHDLTRGPGLRVHVRAGWRWRWLLAGQEVERQCSFHGGCDGGYYRETPHYGASGPVFAIGVGGRTRGDYWAGFGAELAVARAVIDRPGMDPDLGDVLVTLGMNVALGRGAH
jgi:hypothetical protein